MIRTKLDGFALFIERGQGVVTVQLTRLHLVGGPFYAEAWLLNQSDSMNTTSTGCRSDWFTIRGAALSHSESSVFEPKTRWSHYQTLKSTGADAHAKRMDDLVRLESGKACHGKGN